MDRLIRTSGLAVILSVALLAGCQGDIDPTSEGDVRLPLISQARRPHLSDQAPASPYMGETAREMGQPGPGQGAPGTATAATNRPAERRPSATSRADYVPEPTPLPILARDDTAARPRAGADGEETLSVREAGRRLKVVNTIVARVNDEIITREDLLRGIRTDMAIWREALPPDEFETRVRIELRSRLRAEIGLRLVLREARKGLNEPQQEYLDKEVDKERTRQQALAGGEAAWLANLARSGLTEESWRKSQTEWITAQSFLAAYMGPRVTVTRQEMLDYYTKAKEAKYVVKAQERMQLIRLRQEDHTDEAAMLNLARSLASRARTGEDFGKLAREHSKGPKADDGGDWGMMHRGSYRVEAVNEALATLPVGGVSDPIVHERNVYIVKVAGRVKDRVVPFTEVQDECRNAVKRAKQSQMVARYIDSLYVRNHVEVYEDNL